VGALKDATGSYDSGLVMLAGIAALGMGLAALVKETGDREAAAGHAARKAST
jgi:hypothetical protein